METENQSSASQNQIDLTLLLHDMLRGALKFWWLLLIFCAAFSGYFLYQQQKFYVPMYRSSASFTVAMGKDADSGYSYMFYYDRGTASQMARTFPYILESELLTDLVKQDLNVDYINGSISASAVDNSNLFTLSVTSRSADDAKTILDAVIRNYPTVSRYVIGSTQLNMIEAAKVPTEPFNHIGKRQPVMKGVMIGGGLWLALILLYAYFRETIKTEEQIKNRLNAVSLGVVPLVSFKKRKSGAVQEVSIRNSRIGEGFRESVRKIALRLTKNMQEKSQKVLAVTAVSNGEGSSMLAVNLAYAMSESGGRVLLVRQSDEAEHSAFAALRIVSVETTPYQVQITEAEGMFLASVPNRFRGELTWNQRNGSFEQFIRSMKKEYDFIIIDAGTGSVRSDAATAVQSADAFIMVMMQDVAPIAKINDFTSQLRDYGAELAGCILNGASGGMFGYGYGYGYGYGKYGSYRYSSYGKYGRSYGKSGYGYSYGYGEQPKKDEKAAEKNK